MRTRISPADNVATTEDQTSWVALAGVAVAVFALALASLTFAREVGRIAAVWPANALLLAVLLRSPTSTWWRYLIAGLVGNFAADLVDGDVAATAAALCLCNGLEVTLCSALMRRFAGRDVDLGRQKHLMLFLAFAGGLAPFVSAAGAALILLISRGAPLIETLRGWYGPDALGLLVVTPALLVLTPETIASLRRAVRAGRGLVSIGVLTLTLALIFAQTKLPLYFLIPPALIMIAFELGLAGAALAVLSTATLAVVMTLSGHGVAAALLPSLAQRLVVLQVFLAVTTVAVLAVAAALAKRDRLEDALRASLADVEAARAATAESHRLAGLAQQIAGIGYWRNARPSGARVWSDQTYAIHGLAREAGGSPPRNAIELYHPEDRARLSAVVDQTFATGEPFDLKVRLHRKDDGRERVVVFKGEADRGSDGTVGAIFGVMRDVTEEETARRKVEDSEARYRLLADSSTDIVVKLGPDSVIKYVSPSIGRYGHAPADLVGVSAFTLIHPDDQAKVAEIVRDLFTTGRADPMWDRTYRIRTTEGAYVWMEGNPAVVHGDDGAPRAVVTQLRDITERRLADAALAKSELRYRVIAENATDLISRTGVDGRITYVSPAVDEVTGYAAEDLTGKSLISYMHPDDREATIAIYRQIVAGERAGHEPISYRIRHKAGHWMWLECNPTLLRDADGTPSEFIDVCRDVTARMRMEDDLRAARDAAEEAAAVKASFLANMSHEIRTPLTAILGFTNLITERATLDETSQGHLARVASAGQALLSIVNDVLDFSKLEAGQFEIAPRPVATEDMLREALFMFTPQAETKGLTLAFAADDHLPAWVSADPDRLRQILVNLIGNAIKFTEQGSIRLVASYDPALQKLEVRVEDTGAGMNEAQQHKLFQRFSQVDASSTRRHGGTGLGLAICKGLAEAMGGDIDVDSRPDVGSVFHFRIAAPTVAAPAAVASAEMASIEGLRLLVADDNRVNRELARAILTSLGAEVTEAVDGLNAVEVAQTMPFDAILMDIRMPGLDGVDAAARIRRERGPNQDVPILAFSADADLTQFEDSASDFDGIVRKPMVPADLVAAVMQALRWDRAAASTEAVHAASI